MLEFEPTDRPKVDPLKGRLGSTDTRKQVRRSFPTGGSAIASAERRGWDGTACTLRERTARPKSYAERSTAGTTRAAA